MAFKNKVYFKSFDYFRGIAILFIVFGHSFEAVGWTPDTVPARFIANLALGGSVLFVFISGFLFYRVYCRKFDFLSYMEKKIKTVEQIRETPYLQYFSGFT